MGKLINVAMIVVGVGLVAIPSGVIAAGFMVNINDKQ